jgi:hypothetical protein
LVFVTGRDDDFGATMQSNWANNSHLKKSKKKSKVNRNVLLFGSYSKFEGGPRLAQNFSPSLRCPWNEQSKT